MPPNTPSEELTYPRADALPRDEDGAGDEHAATDEHGTADEHGSAGGDPARSPDDIFGQFVQRANTEWLASVEAVLSEPERTDAERVDTETDRVILLTGRRKRVPSTAPDTSAEEITVRRTVAELLRARPPRGSARSAEPDNDEPTRVALDVRASRRAADAPDGDGGAEDEGEWTSIVPERSESTQRREAAKLVPDVASVTTPPAPLQEGSEDGQMPSGELDRKLGDMDVLIRYGHGTQAEQELEALRLMYPHDLLLLRRIAELYIAHGMRAPALEALFSLAQGLFERRNVEGMRAALEQVKVLDPDNGRAPRLLALLEQRPPSSPPPRARG